MGHKAPWSPCGGAMSQNPAAARPVRHIRLDFGADPSKAPTSLSAVEQIENSLWLAGDETASIERLTTTNYARYGDHNSYSLQSFFTLPGGPAQEVDLEGLAVDQEHHRLWLVGSHSL